MKRPAACLTAAVWAVSTHAFLPACHFNNAGSTAPRPSLRSSKDGRGVNEPKGFGKAPTPATQAISSNKNTALKPDRKPDAANSKAPVTRVPLAAVEEQLEETANQQAAREMIAKMNAESDARKAAQRQRVDDIRAAQRITKEDPNAGIIPELVSNRMLQRMIPFFLLPVVAGIGAFVYFFVLAKRYETGFEPGMVALVTQAPFGLSLFGITYAILSASWDPEIEGSALGLTEIKQNLGSILEGLRRSSERQELDEQLNQEQQRLKRAERREQTRNKDEP